MQTTSTPTVNSTPPLPISRVGRFYLTEKLGTGTNGTVYRGHDPVIDRDVAIKILGGQLSISERKQREQQFINEARAAGRLSHPNIVTIFDASSEGGNTFIAMEFLPGKDLKRILAEGKRFDFLETATIIKKIADALAYAHQHGVIHRDIKPANIFVLANHQPKVVDFGIARAPNRVASSSGHTTLFHHNILGTPNYMSPEQASGKSVTAHTDIYSLGAVMYEMLTGQKPFQSSDMDKLLNQIINKTPKYPSDITPGVPDSLSKIVMKAMHKDPAQRYEDAAAMALALERFLERDKKLKRKRGATAGNTNHPVSQAHKAQTSWLSWLALILACAAGAVYWLHR